VRKRSRKSKSGTGGARRLPSTRPNAERRPLRPRRRFGQHFLEPTWVDKLIQVIDPSPDETFLEIGPGHGALTRALAPRVSRIIAVEIDRDLAAALPARVPDNVHLVIADFLEIDLAALLQDEPRPLRVVGNLPYNISSPILFRLLRHADEGRKFLDATVMLQKEVADRLVATPGRNGYGTLALQTALASDVERLLTLPPGAFRPPPKVTSAVVRLGFRPRAAEVDPAAFERVVRAIFVHRRKTLLNALRPLASAVGRAAEDVIEQAGLNPSQRPETLTVADVARLSRAVL
jgi:16S rRNA (adenine1518-N6/adenine1519-N6)-dimethyltransferase